MNPVQLELKVVHLVLKLGHTIRKIGALDLLVLVLFFIIPAVLYAV